MAKTKYSKVEDALEKGVRDLKVQHLLKEADIAQGKAKSQEDNELSPKQMMTLIDIELKWLYKHDRNVYKTLNLKRTRIDELIKRVSTPNLKLKQSELDEIHELKKQVHALKNKAKALEDNELLEKEIEKHVYKRHNVKEKWLPLDTHADWNKYKKPKR